METFIYSGKISETMCDKLVQFYKDNPDRHVPDKYCQGKTSSEIVLNRGDAIYKEYDKHLAKVLKSYLKKYKQADNVIKFEITPTIKINIMNQVKVFLFIILRTMDEMNVLEDI